MTTTLTRKTKRPGNTSQPASAAHCGFREVHTEWHALIPKDQWALYCPFLDAMETHAIPFILGGAFSLATYSGRWRNTKDLDCFVREQDFQAAVDLLKAAGFHDLFDEQPYQRHWIFRGTKDGVIIDIIWQTPNRRSKVEDDWIARAPTIDIYGRCMRVLPADVLVGVKLYVLQRDRCDWTDVFNILYGAGATLDWDRLIAAMDGDSALLAGALNVFAWLCPGQALKFPAGIWEQLQVPKPEGGARVDEAHVNLLDSRPWFGPEVPPDEPLGI